MDRSAAPGNGQLGATLLSTLFVIVLLGSLAGLVVVGLGDTTRLVPEAAGPPAVTGQGGSRSGQVATPIDAAGSAACKADYQSVAQAVATSRAVTGVAPSDVDQLVKGGWLSQPPSSNRGYRIEVGTGPNGEPGTVLVNGRPGAESCDLPPP